MSNTRNNDKNREPKKQFDEPISMDFQTQTLQGGCPVKDAEDNCLVPGVFEDSAPIGGA